MGQFPLAADSVADETGARCTKIYAHIEDVEAEAVKASVRD
jgi:hypothetical protein